ncbi:MAG: SRPBCC family protein [Myxococcota bacterium]|jgi:hypothetical protein|nr:SRPBCC family protein [Myxococcota bacterium]
MLEVSVTRDSDLSAETVYELLADFGDTSWMNGVAKVEIEGEGVGMVRLVFASTDGPPVHEKLTARDDLARKVSYEITEGNPLPVENYAADCTVTELGNGCQLEWTGRFDARGVDDETAKTTVEGMYNVMVGWVLDRAAEL